MISTEMLVGLQPSDALIAVMGATGTGKSTFIKLLTNDQSIVIGHKTESETSDIAVSSYFDHDAGRSVFLVDTPGFDDSREGVTDTDILEKIVQFLQPKEGGRKLNGIIYLHRISDPRVGGVSRKNLKMFKELCGAEQLGNVRIVTTYWSHVDAQAGGARETDLATTAFKLLIGAGAVLRRHDDTTANARSIVAELVGKAPVMMQIQLELNEGRKLVDTSAGAVINEEIIRLQKKHEEEIAFLKREMEEAARVKDEALRAELAEERRALELRMTRADEDRRRLQKTLDDALETMGFSLSSRNIRVEHAVLQADCRKRDGCTWLASYLPLDAVLANIDGKFGPGCAFSRSALDVALRHNLLVAQLQKIGGSWVWAQVNLDDFIRNVDGVLVADMAGFRG